MERMRWPVAVFLAALGVAVAPTPSTADEAALVTLEAHCFSAAKPLHAMETEYYGHQCWGHWGTHTYFVGKEHVYWLASGWARVFSVEQQLSPPSEGYAANTAPPQVTTPILVETSLDGRSWSEVAAARYRFAGAGMATRSFYTVSFEGNGSDPFRFVRFRQPESVAMGLSGYLDHSVWILNVTDLGPAPEPVLVPADESNHGRKCASADHMEAIFPNSPCSFGEVEHWDTPSWFHTYFLDNASLTGLSGKVTSRLFRPDDPFTCAANPASSLLSWSILAQVSVDGMHWTTVGEFPATHGLETEFDVPFDETQAAFVRLIGSKHPCWTTPSNPAPLKHPEAFLTDSKVRLHGLVPG